MLYFAIHLLFNLGLAITSVAIARWYLGPKKVERPSADNILVLELCKSIESDAGWINFSGGYEHSNNTRLGINFSLDTKAGPQIYTGGADTKTYQLVHLLTNTEVALVRTAIENRALSELYSKRIFLIEEAIAKDDEPIDESVFQYDSNVLKIKTR